jgi:hypothetical protein
MGIMAMHNFETPGVVLQLTANKRVAKNLVPRGYRSRYACVRSREGPEKEKEDQP